MSTFTSTIEIKKPANEVYTFLADFNNHKVLMPDNVKGWTSNYDEASFDVQGMRLKVKIATRETDSRIAIVPVEKPPFDVKLVWEIKSGNDLSVVTFTITAELNMMMKMMVSGPLQKLAEYQTHALGGQLN